MTENQIAARIARAVARDDVEPLDWGDVLTRARKAPTGQSSSAQPNRRRPWVASAAAVSALAVGLLALLVVRNSGTDRLAPAGAEQAPFVDDRAGLIAPGPLIISVDEIGPPGIGYNAPPPAISSAVLTAASDAGCVAQGWASEANPSKHVAGDAASQITVPPLSGAHNARWADWGVYDRPVPFKYQIHNLEHGGVFIHYGRDVSVESVNALRQMWVGDPAYLLVAPDTAAAFPRGGVVAGSWQRWISCPDFSPAKLPAVAAFVAAYRGRGPESVLPGNPGGELPADLPTPRVPVRNSGG